MTTKRMASDIAGNPDLFNKVVKLPHSRCAWECIGYSRTGETVKFARLVDGGQLRDGTPWPRQISRYIDPDTLIEVCD
jgi:hypothetical protein